MNSYCYDKKYRLLKQGEFRQVFEKPAVWKDNFFTVLVRKNEENHARLGLIISKKMVKLAVNRNKIKRVIREVFRLSKVKEKPLNIVVIARKGTTNSTKQQIRLSLINLWEKINNNL